MQYEKVDVPAFIAERVTTRFPKHRRRPGSDLIETICPNHKNGQEQHPSFAYNSKTGAFRCHACPASGRTLKELCAFLGIDHPFPGKRPAAPATALSGRIAATYPYRDEGGHVLFEVVRYEPKSFRQRRPNGKGWIWNINDVRLVLYRLPEIPKAPPDATIFVVEGEKDADRLASLGLIATTCPMGAGKWRPEFSQTLRGRNVVILPDNDESGRRHAVQVAESLRVTMSVTIVHLPNLPVGGDVSDFLDAGGTREELERLVEAAVVEEAPVEMPREAEAGATTDPDNGGATNTAEGLRLISASGIEPSSVQWLLPNRIPLNSIVILAGEPGTGKSTLTVCWVAEVSRGTLHGALEGVPSNVLLVTSEDAYAEVVVPRLHAAGADLARVHFVELQWDGERGDLVLTPENLDLLRSLVLKVGARLLVIDPLVGHLPGEIDPHQDAAVRRVLAPLARLAAEVGLTIIVIMHLNKGEARSALNRIGGSIGFVAASRSVLLFGKHPQDSDGSDRILAHIKSNYGPLAPALHFRIESRDLAHRGELIPTSAIRVIGEAPDVSADDVLAPDASQKKRPKGEEAEAYLLSRLANGPVSATILYEEAAERDISTTTLQRAKKRLQVTSSIPTGTFTTDQQWMWALPSAAKSEAQGGGVG